MKEIWKSVPDFEGLYEISNLGRVKSLPKQLGVRWREEKIIKNNIDSHGYCYVVLCKNKKTYPRRVHRLVMLSFVGDYPDMIVNHLDFNKQNNALDNLEYVTTLGNIRYSRDRGRYNESDKATSIKLYNKTHTRLQGLLPRVLDDIKSGLSVSAACRKHGTSNRTFQKHGFILTELTK